MCPYIHTQACVGYVYVQIFPNIEIRQKSPYCFLALPGRGLQNYKSFEW